MEPSAVPPYFFHDQAQSCSKLHRKPRVAWEPGKSKTQTRPPVVPLRLKILFWRVLTVMILLVVPVFNILIAIINCITDRCTHAFRACRGVAPKGRELLEGENPIDELDMDAEDFSFKKVREDYVKHSIPFVLFSSSGKRISDATPPTEGFKDDGRLQVLMDKAFRCFPGLDEIIRALFPCHVRVTPPLWFLGTYTKGLAHIDVMNAAFDCYYLVKGEKDVIIVPHFLTWKMKNLKPGGDNWYVPNSSDPIKGYDYLKGVKSYYRFKMQENTFLIFNSSGCLHHFTNVYHEEDTTSPQALVLHPGYATNSDPRVWASMGLDPRVWLRHSTHMAQLVMNSVFGAQLVLPRTGSKY